MSDYDKGYRAGRQFREEKHERYMARMGLATAIAAEVIRSPWVKPDGTRSTAAAGIAATVGAIVKAVERELSL